MIGSVGWVSGMVYVENLYFSGFVYSITNYIHNLELFPCYAARACAFSLLLLYSYSLKYIFV